MKTQTKKRDRNRPVELHDKSIGAACNETVSSLHRIDKTKVTVYASEDSSDSAEGTGDLGAFFEPTDADMVKINSFTKETVTKDEVAAYKTNSMNDMFDRDDERFTTDTVNEFAALPDPQSFVGKSYMADHGRSISMVKGRIFDVGTDKIKGATFLTNNIYTPKTAQYADHLENLKFGMNWAVSVGVVVDKQSCTLCDAPVHSMWGWSWCESGHEKGFYYVPGKEEEDKYGYMTPVDPSTKGAQKARVDLKDAVEAYELSQVFLGAQFFAELASKEPTASFGSVLKAAKRRSIPIVGLSSKEATSMTFPREPKEVAEARTKFSVIEEDGILKWKDEKGMGWAYDPGSNDKSALCLGLDDVDDAGAGEDEPEDAPVDDPTLDNDQEEEGEDQGDSSKLAKAALQKRLKSWRAAIKEAGDPDDLAEIATGIDGLADALDVLADDLLDEIGLSEVEEDGSVAAAASKPTVTAVLQAATKSKLPSSIVEKLATADDKNALGIAFSEVSKVIKEQSSKITTLEPKAKIGDDYVAELETKALHWYQVKMRDPKSPSVGVDVTLAQKLITQCKGDVETIKSLLDEWMGEAKAKFPKATRHSVVPVDPGEKGISAEHTVPVESLATASKLHSDSGRK